MDTAGLQMPLATTQGYVPLATKPVWQARAQAGVALRVAYAKHGESRSIPLHDVLTATLQAVKMEARRTAWGVACPAVRPGRTVHLM